MIVLALIVAAGLLLAVVFVCLITPKCDRRPGFITERRRR